MWKLSICDVPVGFSLLLLFFFFLAVLIRWQLFGLGNRFKPQLSVHSVPTWNQTLEFHNNGLLTQIRNRRPLNAERGTVRPREPREPDEVIWGRPCSKCLKAQLYWWSLCCSNVISLRENSKEKPSNFTLKLDLNSLELDFVLFIFGYQHKETTLVS